MKSTLLLMALTALIGTALAGPINVATATTNGSPTRRAAATIGDTSQINTADGKWTLVITSQSGSDQGYNDANLNDVKDEYDDAIDDAADDATTATGTFEVGDGYDLQLTLNTANGNTISSYDRESWKLAGDALGTWTTYEEYPSAITASIALENTDIIGSVSFSYGQMD